MKQLTKDDVERVKVTDLKPGMVTPDGIVTGVQGALYDEQMVWVQFTSGSRHAKDDVMVDVIAQIDVEGAGW